MEMKKIRLLLFAVLLSCIPFAFIVACGIKLFDNPLTEATCILNNKSFNDYNCSGSVKGLGGSCGPTEAYELKYEASRKGSNKLQKIYGGKGQFCMCYLVSDLYAKIDLPNGLYPVIGIDLIEYNQLVIGQQFKCYTDSSGEICKSNHGITTNEIYTIILICSTILIAITIVTIIVMCCTCDPKRYIKVNSNIQ